MCQVVGLQREHTGSASYWVEEVDNSSKGTHTGSASYWVEQVDNSSMGTHTGSASHWVEAG